MNKLGENYVKWNHPGTENKYFMVSLVCGMKKKVNLIEAELQERKSEAVEFKGERRWREINQWIQSYS